MERHYQQTHPNAAYIFKEINRYADEQQANWQRRIEGRGNDLPYALSHYQFIHGWVIKDKFKCCVVAIESARIVTINDQYK